MTRIMRPREQQKSASMRRCRFDDAVIQSYRAPPPLSSLFLLQYSFSSSPFFALSSSSSSSSPSLSSARASYFERGIRGRNRKRHGRVSNRYSIAVSPRTGPSLSARSTDVSSETSKISFRESLEIFFFEAKLGGEFLFLQLGEGNEILENFIVGRFKKEEAILKADGGYACLLCAVKCKSASVPRREKMLYESGGRVASVNVSISIS